MLVISFRFLNIEYLEFLQFGICNIWKNGIGEKSVRKKEPTEFWTIGRLDYLKNEFGEMIDRH